MVQAKTEKNIRITNRIYDNLSIDPILKNNNQDLLKKETKKNVKDVRDNKVICIEHKSTVPNKKKQQHQRRSQN